MDGGHWLSLLAALPENVNPRSIKILLGAQPRRPVGAFLVPCAMTSGQMSADGSAISYTPLPALLSRAVSHSKQSDALSTLVALSSSVPVHSFIRSFSTPCLRCAHTPGVLAMHVSPSGEGSTDLVASSTYTGGTEIVKSLSRRAL